MESTNNKELIHELAHALIRARLSGEHLAYANSIQQISGLLMSTQDQVRTRHIFMAVLNQAIELGKTYSWVERELLFEVIATTFEGNRNDALGYDLRQAPTINDQQLDLYNERLNRFSSTNEFLRKVD